MELTPSEIGARAEREVSYALERAGWHVYLPVFAPHARVDLIAVRDDRVERVQVKTSRVIRGALAFRVCSNTANVPKDSAVRSMPSVCTRRSCIACSSFP